MATEKVESPDMKLEVVALGVSDVDRAKAFYEKLGWRLDADFATGDDWRVVQMTPHNSDASIIFGKGIASAKPGLADSLVLAVDDLDAAERARALERTGVDGVFSFENAHDLFFPLVAAAPVCSLDLMTNVAIAFPGARYTSRTRRMTCSNSPADASGSGSAPRFAPTSRSATAPAGTSPSVRCANGCSRRRRSSPVGRMGPDSTSAVNTRRTP